MDRKIEMFNHVVIVFSIMGLLAAVFILFVLLLAVASTAWEWFVIASGRCTGTLTAARFICSMTFTKAVRGDSTLWAAKMLAIRFKHLKEENKKLAIEFLREVVTDMESSIDREEGSRSD